MLQCPQCDTPVSPDLRECSCGFRYERPATDMPVTRARRREEGKQEEQPVLPYICMI
jgi:hypothetical protein